MVSCKVRGCKNRSDNQREKKLHFFSFPRDEEMLSKWLTVCKENVYPKTSRVCSVHFKPSCYRPKPDHLKDLNFPVGVRTLLNDAVPTEHIGTDEKKEKKAKVIQPIKRKRRSAIRNARSERKDATVNNQSATYIYVLDNQSHPISSPMTSVKYVSNRPNYVRLEHVEAPAHVLDHQYAVEKQLKSGVLNNLVANQNENNLQFNRNIIIKNEPKSTEKNSDEEKIAKLQMELKKKTLENQKLQKQLKRLQDDSKDEVKTKVNEILTSIFSPRQIDKLMNPYKIKIKWTLEDIISAIQLQNVSLKAYRYLRDKNYPLPGLSTIRKWTATMNMDEGILVNIINLMKSKAKSLSVFQKIVVLHFGDTSIIDKKCRLCIVRGLFYEWVQPIYYSYDEPLSATIIKNITSKLYSAGYIVVAVTCIPESHDIHVWRDLNVGIGDLQKCYFEHPSNKTYKVFVFPNEYRLLALIRKLFLDSGLVIRGKLIDKDCLEEIVNISAQMEGDEFHITQEILEHANYEEPNLTNVKNFFSKGIAEEIYCYGQEGFMVYKNWKEVAELFETLSEWIDLFNSKTKREFNEGEEPFGLCFENQNNILRKIEKLMCLTKIKDFERTLVFQEQVILACISLRQLLKYLQESFSIEDFQIKYILTYRLGSEVLENFLVYLSGKDIINYQPSFSRFLARLRKCVMGKYKFDETSTLKCTEPCIIDFNERSSSSNTINVQKPKAYVSETAKKMQKFLSENNISTEKVHKNLLHIISKNS